MSRIYAVTHIKANGTVLYGLVKVEQNFSLGCIAAHLGAAVNTPASSDDISLNYLPATKFKMHN